MQDGDTWLTLGQDTSAALVELPRVEFSVCNGLRCCDFELTLITGFSPPPSVRFTFHRARYRFQDIPNYGIIDQRRSLTMGRRIHRNEGAQFVKTSAVMKRLHLQSPSPNPSHQFATYAGARSPQPDCGPFALQFDGATSGGERSSGDSSHRRARLLPLGIVFGIRSNYLQRLILH